MAERSYPITGIVLKRIPTGEKDVIATILTQEKGKLVCVAKGVRSLTSKSSSALEPGSLSKGLCIVTKSLPILTQTKLLEELRPQEATLAAMRSITQFLEILDRLFVEEEIEPEVFAEILSMHELLRAEKPHRGLIRTKLLQLIQVLGFAEDDPDKYESVLEYVGHITERPMRSYDYLVVKRDNR